MTALDQLRAARFDGPQALYTTAVQLLSERPAVPDDLAGLVARARYMVGNPSAWDGYDESASEMIRLLADAIEALAGQVAATCWMLAAREPQCVTVRPILADGGAIVTRPEAEVRAEAHAAGMREAAKLCAAAEQETKPGNATEAVIFHLGFTEGRKVCERAILDAIPQTQTHVDARTAG